MFCCMVLQAELEASVKSIDQGFGYLRIYRDIIQQYMSLYLHSYIMAL